MSSFKTNGCPFCILVDYYIKAQWNNDVTNPAVFESPIVETDMDQCLTFSFISNVKSNVVLKLLSRGESDETVWKINNCHDYHWHESHVNIPAGTKQLVFSLDAKSLNTDDVIGIDSVSMNRGICEGTKDSQVDTLI